MGAYNSKYKENLVPDVYDGLTPNTSQQLLDSDKTSTYTYSTATQPPFPENSDIYSQPTMRPMGSAVDPRGLPQLLGPPWLGCRSTADDKCKRFIRKNIYRSQEELPGYPYLLQSGFGSNYTLLVPDQKDPAKLVYPNYNRKQQNERPIRLSALREGDLPPTHEVVKFDDWHYSGQLPISKKELKTGMFKQFVKDTQGKIMTLFNVQSDNFHGKSNKGNFHNNGSNGKMLKNYSTEKADLMLNAGQYPNGSPRPNPFPLAITDRYYVSGDPNIPAYLRGSKSALMGTRNVGIKGSTYGTGNPVNKQEFIYDQRYNFPMYKNYPRADPNYYHIPVMERMHKSKPKRARGQKLVTKRNLQGYRKTKGKDEFKDNYYIIQGPKSMYPNRDIPNVKHISTIYGTKDGFSTGEDALFNQRNLNRYCKYGCQDGRSDYDPSSKRNLARNIPWNQNTANVCDAGCNPKPIVNDRTIAQIPKLQTPNFPVTLKKGFTYAPLTEPPRPYRDYDRRQMQLFDTPPDSYPNWSYTGIDGDNLMARWGSINSKRSKQSKIYRGFMDKNPAIKYFVGELEQASRWREWWHASDLNKYNEAWNRVYDKY